MFGTSSARTGTATAPAGCLSAASRPGLHAAVPWHGLAGRTTLRRVQHFAAALDAAEGSETAPTETSDSQVCRRTATSGTITQHCCTSSQHCAAKGVGRAPFDDTSPDACTLMQPSTSEGDQQFAEGDVVVGRVVWATPKGAKVDLLDHPGISA